MKGAASRFAAAYSEYNIILEKFPFHQKSFTHATEAGFYLARLFYERNDRRRAIQFINKLLLELRRQLLQQRESGSRLLLF